jgi:predicted RND superfamily exporter protein
MSEPGNERRLERAFAALGRAVHRRPGTVLLALVLSLVPAGWLTFDLEVRASFLDLLPEDEPPVIQLRTVLDHARSTTDVTVAISTADRALAERFAHALLEELSSPASAREGEPEIANVGGYVDLDWFRDRRLLYVPEDELARIVLRARESIDRELLGQTGLYVDLLEEVDEPESPEALLAEMDEDEEPIDVPGWIVTNDGLWLCIWAYFPGNSGDVAFGRAAWDRVRRTVDGLRDGERFPRDLDVRYAGGIPTRVEDERALSSDLQLAGSIGFFAVVLLIVAALRAPRALVLLSVPLFVGLLWTFAFARLAIGHLNIITGFLFSILSGLGIEYGIHLLHRFRELREEGLELDVAIERLVASTGRALLSGSLGNASVFAVIAAAQFSGFSEFGLIAAVGLLLTLVATLVGLPALIVLSERIRPIAWKRRDERERGPVRIPAALRWLVLVSVPALALASAVALARGEVRFDGNWRALAGETEVSRFQEYLRHHFGGLYTRALIFVPEDRDLPGVVGAIGAVRDARGARGEPFEVVEVGTREDVLPPPESQARRAALAAELGEELRRIPRSSLEPDEVRRLDDALRWVSLARPFGAADLPYSVIGGYSTRDGGGSIVHVRVHESDDADTSALVSWAEQSREIAAALHERGIVAPMLSENWVAGEIFERIAADARFLAVGTLVAVFLVLLLDFRRPFVALGVLGSVLLGVLSIAGTMWCTGLELNFMNATILPSCVGISLDNAIHVYHRWREGGPGSIPNVLRHTTAANALASSTNLLGFAALALTHHEGLRSVAYLAMIGVTATYVSTTIWFPIVLDTLDRWRRPPRAEAGAPSAAAG